jgi:pyruvate dehydrogenase E2 component (dihydrolipoamide acetyltransferase)
MASPVLMPRPGQMTEECVVQTWHKREGDAVRRGEVLFEIETDKSIMEVEAFEEGVLLAIVVPEGGLAPVNTVVAWVGEAGEQVPETPALQALPIEEASEAAPLAVSPVTPAPAAAQAPTPPTVVPAAGPPPAAGSRLAISPRASRLAAELRVEPRSVPGTGPGGRIVERDVRAAAERAGRMPDAVTPASTQGDPVDGSGEPLSRLRQVIAARLTESVTTAPQFDVTVPVDMTGVVALRTELRRDGSAITITDLIHHAVAQALVELPLVNARTDGRTLWRRSTVHLGIAVSVPGGLVVPVIRDAANRSLADLHDAAASLIEAARGGRATPDMLSGSTFTVSNMGMFGVERFTAIINPGESGILAVSSVLPTAVAVGEGLAVRQIMRITLTADHRLIDGELAARFVQAIRRRLEDVEEWRRLARVG